MEEPIIKSYCTYIETLDKNNVHRLYHDNEYGFPLHNDEELFGRLVLEINQAGLSWDTILKKKENFFKAYDNFDVLKVAKYNEKKIEKLLNDPGIIRNRLKISSAIRNAQLFMDVQKEFGSFNNYLYSFMPGGKPITEYAGPHISTPESDAIAKDMKKRGFKFFGTTICYAHMQATGMVNDHINGCAFK